MIRRFLPLFGGLLLGVPFLFAGFYLIGVVLSQHLSGREARARWQEIPARVVAREYLPREGGRHRHRWVVRYEFEWERRRVQSVQYDFYPERFLHIRFLSFAPPASLKSGVATTCRVNPSNPAESVLSTDIRHASPILSLSVPFVGLGATFVLWPIASAVRRTRAAADARRGIVRPEFPDNRQGLWIAVWGWGTIQVSLAAVLLEGAGPRAVWLLVLVLLNIPTALMIRALVRGARPRRLFSATRLVFPVTTLELGRSLEFVLKDPRGRLGAPRLACVLRQESRSEGEGGLSEWKGTDLEETELRIEQASEGWRGHLRLGEQRLWDFEKKLGRRRWYVRVTQDGHSVLYPVPAG